MQEENAKNFALFFLFFKDFSFSVFCKRKITCLVGVVFVIFAIENANKFFDFFFFA